MDKVLCTALRNYVFDLLPRAPSAPCSERVIFVCRLLGCVTIFGVAAVSICHAGTIPVSQLIAFALFVLAVAVLVGNLVKEVAMLIAGVVLNWRGCEFHRTRLTLGGAKMTEIYRPDGTWDRYFRETLHSVHEWSDLQGECHREILDPSARI